MHTQVMSDAMIRVPAEVRDRLAVIAESHGVSIRSLVQARRASRMVSLRVSCAGLCPVGLS
ncbi:Arc family DNA-binding protein [Streptomyces cinereoruber]|uniref:Arc family DNA-binding protein n=2 Tax=Streptomyces cinereoruber TaxID=67260 RepID=UPI003570CF9C